MKKHSYIFPSSLFVAALIFSSCGGGGGGGTPQPTATYLYYVNSTTGGLFFYDPVTKATTTVEDGTTGHQITRGSDFIGGSYRSANKQLTDVHQRTLVYAKDDGKLYKVSLLKSGTKTPEQVSNETGAATVCDNQAIPDIANPDNSVYAYSVPVTAPTVSCDSATDVWKAVRLNSSPTTTPMEITSLNMKPVTEVRDWSTGALVGQLAVDGANEALVKCTTDFTSANCTTVLSAPTHTVLDAVSLGVDSNARKIYLSVFDGTEYQMLTYDSADDIISEPVYTTTNKLVKGLQDGSALYFAETPHTLKKITFTTSEVVSLLTETDARNVKLTDNAIVYVAYEDIATGGTDTLYKLKSTTKASPPTTTVLAADPQNIDLAVVAGDRVFYNLGSGPTATAGSVKDNNTGRQEASEARWTAASYSSTMKVPTGTVIPQKVIMSRRNLELWSYNTTAYAYTPGTGLWLGTMPGAPMDTFRGGGVRSDILGYSGDWEALDIFTVNVNTVDSLSRVTTTGDNEQPFFW